MITRKQSKQSNGLNVDNETKENFKTPTKPKKTAQPKRKSPRNSPHEEASPPKSPRTKSSRSSESSPTSSLSPIADQMKENLHISTEKSKFRSARRALVQNQNYSLPGREKEWNELVDYLEDHIADEKSGSLYLSGAPGTGKTATLMKLINTAKFKSRLKIGFVNCTSIGTKGSIYKKICFELHIRISSAPSEKECLDAIDKFLNKKHQMTLLILDEIDQLCGKGQKQNDILYRIFEWPSIINSKLILVGIANSLDLTDRLLIRLQTHVQLKPTVMHFSAYTKAQISEIFKSRLEESGSDLFPPAAIALLAAKVSAVSGDIRRALNIGKRVIHLAERERNKNSKVDIALLESVIDSENGENVKDPIEEKPMKQIEMKEVVSVLNDVYGNSQKLATDVDEGYPMLQKILLCTLVLIVKHGKRKIITVGYLCDVFKKVCARRNMHRMDFSEFMSLCDLIEVRGVMRIIKKKEPRYHQVQLQWLEDEIITQLQDKQMIEIILSEKFVLN